MAACNSGPIQPTPTLPKLYTPTTTETPTIAPTSTPIPSATPTAIVYPQDPKLWKFIPGPEYSNKDNLIILENWQKSFAVNTIRDFFTEMYGSDTLVPLDTLANDFDTNSKIWTGDEKTKIVGIKDIYSKLEENKMYIKYEFPISDPAHYTNWLIYGVKNNSNDLKIMVFLTIEPQTYTYKNISDNKMVNGTGVMKNNRKLYSFEVDFMYSAWKISNMAITNID